MKKVTFEQAYDPPIAGEPRHTMAATGWADPLVPGLCVAKNNPKEEKVRYTYWAVFHVASGYRVCGRTTHKRADALTLLAELGDLTDWTASAPELRATEGLYEAVVDTVYEGRTTPQ